MKKSIILLIISLLTITLLTGCTERKDDDIIILFTNDIHAAIDENLTLSTVAAYKKQMQQESKYVTLVDIGDAIQGSVLGSITKGELIIKAMNEVGYDYCVFGNHEFDYGPDRLCELMDMNNAKYLCSNIVYSGSKENNPISKSLPYDIKTYGKTKVAFIGVTTPTTIQESSPNNFKENDEYVYDFMGGNDGETLYQNVQKYVDEVRGKGADFVIVLAHLGNAESNKPFTSEELIKNTTGIDVILDAHSHEIYTIRGIKDKEGSEVLLDQTGTKLENLGELCITNNDLILVSNAYGMEEKDEEVDRKINALIDQYSTQINEVVTTINNDLSIYDETGVRIVRTRETGIGNLCSDAYRTILNADIAYCNGGGVRASLEKGEVTFGDIIDVHPFGNMLCVMEVTGQEVLDMLEYFCRYVEKDYKDADGNPVGEYGAYPCMSGMKFSIDLNVESSVVADENDMLISVGDNRKVKDVYVLENNEYVAIDPNKTYTLALQDYPAKKGGNGMELFLKDHNLLVDSAISDYQVLIDYITDYLDGDLSQYEQIDNRVTLLY